METANGKVGGIVSASKSERAGLGGKIVGGGKQIENVAMRPERDE